MTPYLVFLAVPALMSLFGTSGQTRMLKPIFFLAMLVFIGLRQKVGMDWNNYLILVAKARTQSWVELVVATEPFSGALMKFSSLYQANGIYVLNVFSALVFSSGLFALCFRQRNPWQALSCSIPYLVIVFAMSGVRQAIAIGIVFWLIALWERLTDTRRLVLIGLCAGFHFSGLAVIAFVLYDRLKDIVKVALLSAPVVLLLGVFGVGDDRLDFYYDLYIADRSGRVESPGAFFHVLVVAAPALAYLFWRNKDWGLGASQRRILELAAWLSVLALPFVFLYSTATDRLTMYLSFVPILFYGNVEKLMNTREERVLLNFVLIALNASILVVWMKFANSAIAYLPYKNYLFS